MRKIVALCRASWQVQLSYRMQMVISVVGLVTMVVPLYFISGALQPVMANAIRSEGGQSFGFLLVGLATASLVTIAVTTIPGTISSGIGTGVLEAMLATPTHTPTLLAGLSSYGLLWALLRGAIFVSAGWLLGANLLPHQVFPGLLVLALIVISYVPFGLIAAASVLVFRTAGPLPQGVLLASSLLGGVYYPTQVIPSWLQSFSAFIPMTYGLRALRRVVLEGAPLNAVRSDLLMLLTAAIVLAAIGVAAITAAFRYARQHGTLSQY